MNWEYHAVLDGEIIISGFRYTYDGRQWDVKFNDFWQWLELVEVGGEDRLLFHPANEEMVRLDASDRYRLLPTGLKCQDVLDGMGLVGETPNEPGAPVEDELCPRCGHSMQATHHPLCQAKDGTPTELPDELVRASMYFLDKVMDYDFPMPRALWTVDTIRDIVVSWYHGLLGEEGIRFYKDSGQL